MATLTTFRLRPFLPVPHTAITGHVVRDHPWLTVEYCLTGALGQIQLPATESGQRRDGLWETTCFEMFFATPGSSDYWEVNAAPSGDWNVYAFSGYRQGMVPETNCDRVEISHRRQGSTCYVTLKLALGWITADTPLSTGITAVIDAERLSYWAMVHPDEQPDFHHPGGFCLGI